MQNTLLSEPDKVAELFKELAPNLYPTYKRSKTAPFVKKLMELRGKWLHEKDPAKRKIIEAEAKEVQKEIDKF